MNEIERAIKRHHDLTDGLNSETFSEYRELVLAALREKTERDDPKPLTLEELRERDGKPVWCREIGAGIEEWTIGDPRKRRRIGLMQAFYFSNYGTTWLAYDYPPKEVHPHGKV